MKTVYVFLMAGLLAWVALGVKVLFFLEPYAENPPLTAPPKRDTIFITDTLTLIDQKHMELAETQIGMGYMGSPEHLKEGD